MKREYSAKSLQILATPGGFEPPTLSLEDVRAINEINGIPTSSRFVHGLKALFYFNLSE